MEVPTSAGSPRTRLECPPPRPAGAAPARMLEQPWSAVGPCGNGAGQTVNLSHLGGRHLDTLELSRETKLTAKIFKIFW